MSGILLYLGLLIIGGIFSYRGWIHKAMLARIDRLQMACLFGLLFIMGMRIGMDDRVKEAFLNLHNYEESRQMLTVFRIGKVVEFKEEYLNSTYALLEIKK